MDTVQKEYSACLYRPHTQNSGLLHVVGTELKAASVPFTCYSNRKIAFDDLIGVSLCLVLGVGLGLDCLS